MDLDLLFRKKDGCFLYSASVQCFAMKSVKFLQPLMLSSFIYGLSYLLSPPGQEEFDRSPPEQRGRMRSQESGGLAPALPLMCPAGLGASHFPSLGTIFSTCRKRGAVGKLPVPFPFL